MEPSFEVNPALMRALEEHTRAHAELDKQHAGKPKASEILATNAEVPFSMRLGAQERKLLWALARNSGKSMSQLAREILVEGLMRLESAQDSSQPAVEATELATLIENTRKLTMLAQSVEATAERVARRLP